MCGGRGTRLDADVEKPLLRVGGEPMLDRVARALRESRCETVRAVTSPAAPRTRAHWDGPAVEAPGDGYVADLRHALARVDGPVVTVPADLPLLHATAVDRTLEAHTTGSLAVTVPAALPRLLGRDVDAATRDESDGREVAPTGLNVVGEGPERSRCSFDARLAVNVNRCADADLAEALL
jgi:adenosylcobinamide-phosphate guanylyltransferase